MTLGRPKEFDRTEALERAMEAFWSKGYEGTSVADLLAAMGINRGSMYATFGGKRALFLAAIGHYRQTVAAPLLDTLGGPGSPLGNIRKALHDFAELAESGQCRGCLVINTTIELAARDAEVGKAMKSALVTLEGAFCDALNRAQECGELGPGAETRRLARFAANTLQGLGVLSKGRLGKQTRDDVINVTMAALAA